MPFAYLDRLTNGYTIGMIWTLADHCTRFARSFET